MSKHTPGPWEYIASTEHHGPYVVAGGAGFGDIADCYVMSQPSMLSTAMGGPSKPIHHQAERADANARLIAAAPEMLAVLKAAEWAGERGDCPLCCCKEVQGHQDDCPLAAAIAKAEGK